MTTKAMAVAALLATTALINPGRAGAVVIDDPLHGEVCTSALGGCTNSGDNGTNTPITSNPPVNFGFSSSPAQAGTLTLDFLIPDNINIPVNFPGISVTGSGITGSALATLYSSTPWTAGQLDTYLNINASPTNPIGAFLPSTQTLLGNPAGLDGFFVFQLKNFAAFDLPHPNCDPNCGPGNTLPDIFSVNVFAQGGYIVGFLDTGDSKLVATANSAALFDTTPGNTINQQCTNCAVPGPIVGAGLPGLIAGLFGLVSLNWNRRRRRGENLPA